MPLSQKQTEYLAIAWQCFDSEPKIDYEKFAKLANLASANSARELMRVTKNKLKTEYRAFGGPTKKQGNDGDDGEVKEKKTPASRKRATPGSGRGRGKKAAAAKDLEGLRDEGEDGKGDEGEDGSPSKKTKVKEEPKEDDLFQ